ncbi:MAG TPA: hypothetical protein VJ970_04415 [Flavobacteriaceae bacterium]|nr:hypothetical protein [Flavobacteriaceae bacterium]
MKKLVVLGIFIFSLSISAQENNQFVPSGKPLFDVHWNYHLDLTEDADKTSAFELTRAYLGYSYSFTEAISAKVTFDVGNNDAGTAYTAFLKVAQLDWKVAQGVKLSMGLIGLKQFKVQEKFWGYRYIFKSYQDQYGFGTSADLGINAEFKLANNLTANLTIANGEGYKKIQDVNGKHKIAGNIIYKPVEGLTTKVYADYYKLDEDMDAINAVALFAGYETSNWSLGAEYNMLNNATKYSSPAEDYELDGFSIYSTYELSNKVELFARFDQLNSNTLSGDTEPSNEAKNGNQILAGVQVSPLKGLNFALNYRNFSFDDDAINNKSLIYLNAQFKL